MPLLLALRRYAALLTALLLVSVPLPAETAKPEASHLRTYLVPSSSMAPTLLRGDRLFVNMTAPDVLKRGDLVVVLVRKEQWLKRIAAIPGDRIALHKGVVVLNGHEVPQAAGGDYEIDNEYGLPPERGRKMREQFPGEAAAHEILDLGSRRYDDFAEVTLGPGRYFVLGDNRDNSMDSRMPETVGGIGLVRRDQFLGRVRYRYWRLGEGWKRVDF